MSLDSVGAGISQPCQFGNVGRTLLIAVGERRAYHVVNQGGVTNADEAVSINSAKCNDLVRIHLGLDLRTGQSGVKVWTGRDSNVQPRPGVNGWISHDAKQILQRLFPGRSSGNEYLLRLFGEAAARAAGAGTFTTTSHFLNSLNCVENNLRHGR
jgi:hypothetical protein